MTSSNQTICIDEAAGFGVVVAGLEVVEAGFLIVDVAAVAEGVVLTQGGGEGAGGTENIAPGVVGIPDYHCAGGVHDGNHVALQIGDVVVQSAVQADGNGSTGGIVGEVHGVGGAALHLHQQTAAVDILVGSAGTGTLGTHTAGIIGKGPGLAVDLQGRQLSAVLPGVGAGAVRQRVTNGIIGNGLPRQGDGCPPVSGVN